MPQTGWTLAGPDRSVEFAENVRPLLESSPIRNTVILGRLATNSREPRPGDCYGWWTDDAGEVRAALLMNSPHAVVLSAGVPEQAAAALPGAWADSGRDRPTGVFGQIGIAEQVAAGWVALTGGSYRERPKHSMRLFSFDEPTPPDPAPRGSARLATLDEVKLAVTWDLAFFEDCGIPHDGDQEPSVRARIEQGRQMMWIVDDMPVAQAVHTSPAAGVVRITGVYTPPEHRRNGYAAGLTWAITHEGLAKGVERVLLHTDLSNPTSNGVYQRLGYRAVQDVTEFELTD